MFWYYQDLAFLRRKSIAITFGEGTENALKGIWSSCKFFLNLTWKMRIKIHS